MHFLNSNIEFPDISKASKDGLLAIGGDLSAERLLYAYQNGIFPWFDDEQPILWWSPDPRFVLFPEDLKISKSMVQILKKDSFKVTFNKAFSEVILKCANQKRAGQESSWITNGMIEAYNKLFKLGYAKSVEVWQNNVLVGGLYGVDVGNQVFCGESMFTKVSNASKVGFITFIQQHDYKLIDCQIYTNHLDSLGAKDIPRSKFLTYLIN
ncbi:leucyl/phenylalanyl-tRNA--protein transferase [Ichthyenterobacterium sp. W332]|uniref:Leucyl/phenylalanyl-tRNA--protein transferase n=1 Tax=Microcosmobacter mediterraneus TaxID=3075607 RepID=A0ABU2YKL4_9FLAO|nr:leucyl/phenylalanyl-tRNA--protein transferase [Ichthyenterobacterium sp. W332]MDT0558597.1 leucyl/phenylalanyl-tRNA--protein transferase [Ichthyenterobacterium sp. W332]